jgi:hypothetical protein
MGVWAGAATPLEYTLPGDADVSLVNDRFALPGSVNGIPMAAGDFSGDGVDDFAIYLQGFWQPSEVNLFLGNRSFAGGSFSAVTQLRVILPPPARPLYDLTLTFGDINGDLREDLLIGRPGDDAVYVFFGSTGLPRMVDLNKAAADLTIIGSANIGFGMSLATGDFDGDDIGDVAIGAPNASPLGRSGAGEVALVVGREGFPPVINLTSGASFSRFVGATPWAGLGISLAAAKVRSDKRRSLVTGPWPVNVFRGRDVWPGVWDLAVTGPDAAVVDTANHFFWLGSGDLDADGTDEVLLRDDLSPYDTFILSGNNVLGGGILDLQAGIRWPTGQPIYRVLSGDVDGDGAGDIFSGQTGILSSDLGGVIQENPLTSRSLSILGMTKWTTMGDINGDGRQDILSYRNADVATPSKFGTISVLFGFRPLRNPTAHRRIHRWF